LVKSEIRYKVNTKLTNDEEIVAVSKVKFAGYNENSRFARKGNIIDTEKVTAEELYELLKEAGS